MKLQGYNHANTIIDDSGPPQLRNMPCLAALSGVSAPVTLVGFKLWRGGGWRDVCGGEVRARFGLDLGPRSAAPKSGSEWSTLRLFFMIIQGSRTLCRLITNPRDWKCQGDNRAQYSNPRNNKTSSPFGIDRAIQAAVSSISVSSSCPMGTSEVGRCCVPSRRSAIV